MVRNTTAKMGGLSEENLEKQRKSEEEKWMERAATENVGKNNSEVICGQAEEEEVQCCINL